MHYKEESIRYLTFVGKRTCGRRYIRLHISAHMTAFVPIIKGPFPLIQVLTSKEYSGGFSVAGAGIAQSV